MKYLFLTIFLLPGCASLGEIEGTGKIGEMIRVITKTDSVLNGRSHYSPTAARINRAVAHTEALEEKMDDVSIPEIVQDVQDIYRYVE